MKISPVNLKPTSFVLQMEKEKNYEATGKKL